MVLLAPCATSPTALASFRLPPLGSFDLNFTTLAKDSPAYVQLPQGFSDDVSSGPMLPPCNQPIPVHSQLVCDYFAREGDRQARMQRLLCWAIARGPPPGLDLPRVAKVSFSDESTRASLTTNRSSVLSDFNSEEEEVVLSGTSSDDSSAAAPPESRSRLTRKTLTTIVIRNVPGCYTRESILDLLEQHGLRALCDFLYLPFDFNTGKALGYVFVNFVTAAAAELCHSRIHGKPVSYGGTGAVYEVAWTSAQQGLSANIKRYRNSPVMHASVPDEYKPMVFVEGGRISFPAPRRDIRCPPDVVERTRTAAVSITMTM